MRQPSGPAKAEPPFYANPVPLTLGAFPIQYLVYKQDELSTSVFFLFNFKHLNLSLRWNLKMSARALVFYTSTHVASTSLSDLRQSTAWKMTTKGIRNEFFVTNTKCKTCTKRTWALTSRIGIAYCTLPWGRSSKEAHRIPYSVYRKLVKAWRSILN